MASAALREPITEVWRAEPPAGSRGTAPGQGSGGRSPRKLKAFLLLDVSYIVQYFAVFIRFSGDDTLRD